MSFRGDFCNAASSERIFHWFDVFCIGIAILSPGTTGWSSAYLIGGWGGLVISTIVMSLLWGSLILNLIELSVTFPVAGGSYAYASMTMGNYAGMLTGLTEASELTILSAYWILEMEEIARTAFDIPAICTPFLWFAFLGIAVLTTDWTTVFFPFWGIRGLLVNSTHVCTTSLASPNVAFE